jgi:hypothetical protein
MICSTTTLDFPMIDLTNIVCFESHLMCGLDLPPSKLHVSILNFIYCELVHLHPNAISTLSCFSMLCECWLGIPPDTSLLWYFYSPARYERKVFSSTRLTLRRNHREEYLNVTLRGYLKGASRWWFHVNLDNVPQWPNKHLLPPLIKNKRNNLEMMPCLKALIKWVIDLRWGGLEA